MNDLGVAQPLLEADHANTSSVRVAEKCGFNRIGSRTEPDQQGGRHMTVVFAWNATFPVAADGLEHGPPF